MQGTLEKNGKPCCLNLITEPDSQFLEKLAKAKRIKDNTAELAKVEEKLAEIAANTKTQGEKPKKEDPKSKAAAALLEEQQQQLLERQRECKEQL